MLALLKLLQSLVSTLHSQGTKGQVAAGIALGSALGLTPLLNAHNLIVLLLLMVFNVSFGAGMLGWAIFTPVGFMLDPVFDRIGRTLLLDTPALRPTWASWFNTPGLPYTNFNNTVVLGSVVGWVVLWLPIFALSYFLVGLYRAKVAKRIEESRFFKVVGASKLYNVYRMFHP